MKSAQEYAEEAAKHYENSKLDLDLERQRADAQTSLAASALAELALKLHRASTNEATGKVGYLGSHGTFNEREAKE